ncbi:phosphopantetheine adenylyltransferase [Halobacteriaceae archaeon GCM10025711]
MRVVVAGTFGPLHDGHRALFSEALERGDDGVVVALTSDDLAQQTRHEPRPVPPFEERKRAVTEAIDELDEWGREVDVQKLHDEFGVAIEDPGLDAIVVSPETDEEVAEINRRRREMGMDPLEALVVPYVRAEDGERISSTRVVRGEIDEHGALLDGAAGTG